MWPGQSDSFDVARGHAVRSLLLAAAIAALYALHQDIWFWRTAHPLVFGFLPVGLAYHARLLPCRVAADVGADDTGVAVATSSPGSPRR